LEKQVFREFEISEHRYPMSPIVNLGRVRGGFGAWIIPPKAEADILIHMHPSINYWDAIA